ncbi:MAG: phosphatidate cytidylyltransferase [Bauldia sp.]|nr:phosphatidate cytidylyltransferase [Bauldia sp.]
MTVSPSDSLPPRPAGDLRTRIVSGVILAVVALAGVLVGGWLLAVGLAVVTAAIAWEWTSMSVGHDEYATAAVAAPGVVAVLLVAASQPAAAILVLALGFVGVVIWTGSRWAAGGVIYAALLGISLMAIRVDPLNGIAAVFFVFAVVWGSDTGAYAAGRTFGGPKLWPRVSPKKTWSGLAGGTVAGIAAGLAVVLMTGAAVTPATIVVALVLSLLSAAGDLFESAVKRHFRVKDASNLIPGHGGVMDRVDGLIVASAAAAFIGTLNQGWPLVGTGLILW